MLSVERIDDSLARWTFDATITAAPAGGAGLAINAEVPTSITIASGVTLECTYDDDFSPGDPWSSTPPHTGLTFAGGAVLGTAAGTVS